MNKVTTLGIDLAKTVFQLHGVDVMGKVVWRREVRRAQLMKIVAQLEPCLIGIEACGGANYWARRFAEFGHQVKMMSPQFVKPYRKSDKNDRNDAEAICEAVTRPSMRFVAIKSVEQQDMLTMHRVREGLMKERVALINRIRGSLSEYGIVIAKDVSNLRRELPGILEDAENELTAAARQLFSELYEDLGAREQRIRQLEHSIRALGSQHDVVRRLQTVPGIGYLSATALYGTVGDAKHYRNGRQGLAGYVRARRRRRVNSENSHARTASTALQPSRFASGRRASLRASTSNSAARRSRDALNWARDSCDRVPATKS